MKYHCNLCYTMDIEDGDSLYKKFFKTNVKTDFIRHLKSPKHSKQVEAIKCIPVEEKVRCEGCSKWMTKDAYKEHFKRNERFIYWMEFDESRKTNIKFHPSHRVFSIFRDWPCMCDDYVYKNKRFKSLDNFLLHIEKKEKYDLDHN